MWDLNSARSAPSSSDRRNHRRKNLAARQISVDLGVSGGTITDLSESGVCVRTGPGVSLNRGERVHFAVPDGLKPIQATCELAWASGSGMAGLRFLVLSERSQRHIKEWLTNDDGSGETIWIPAPAAPAKIASKELPAVAKTNGGVQATPAPAVRSLQPELNPAKPVEKQAEARLRLTYGLKLMAELTQLLTAADGAAIALREGENIVCMASTGSAPEVGVRVGEGGLTRECLRSGLTVRADDTQDDARVDAEACRALNIRSIVVVPLFSQGAAAGVLQVLSSKPAAFHHPDVLLLPQVAEMIMRLTEKSTAEEQRARPAPAKPSAAASGTSGPVQGSTPAATPRADASAQTQTALQAPGTQRSAAIDEPDGGQTRVELMPGAKAVWPRLMS